MLIHSGLSGDGGSHGVSLKTSFKADCYLRHADTDIAMTHNGREMEWDDWLRFSQDATFILKKGLSPALGGFSFESMNRRGFFLRHDDDFRLTLKAADAGAEFNDAATYFPRPTAPET